MARRTQGEGSISKREDGRWSVLLSLGVGADGTRLRRSTTCKTQKEARETLKTWLSEQEAGLDTSRAARSLTVEAVMEEFLQLCRDKGLRPRTVENYELLSRGHIIPAIGKMEVVTLNAWTITRFLTTRKKLTGTGEEKLSPRTVRQMRMVLRKALEIARKRRVISVNPTDDAEVPPLGHYQAKSLGIEQAMTLLGALPTHPFGAFYTVMLGLGIRPGEARGLKWEDIVFADQAGIGGWLWVRRQVQRVKGEYREVPVKTKKGNRKVVLPAFVATALKQQQEKQQREILEANELCIKRPEEWKDLVFQNRDGNPIEERYVVRRFHQLTDELNLPAIRLYDLRRTCITVLHAQGVPLAVIKDIVGHSQISVTADYYTDTHDPSRDEAARLINAALSQEEPKKQGEK